MNEIGLGSNLLEQTLPEVEYSGIEKSPKSVLISENVPKSGDCGIVTNSYKEGDEAIAAMFLSFRQVWRT